ncbi:hypothetical protein [Massilia sp. erpn]|uniref:hypothetical protein n=1 Tax=Massilia sp. erpn TaxID=2738142 RepID=UPI002107E880|nr:hypothetical protein [Massilia sp. erpn]UTY58835.1 hypothetical protein HPQ68_17545 [Massilia sp. erpn]
MLNSKPFTALLFWVTASPAGTLGLERKFLKSFRKKVHIAAQASIHAGLRDLKLSSIITKIHHRAYFVSKKIVTLPLLLQASSNFLMREAV